MKNAARPFPKIIWWGLRIRENGKLRLGLASQRYRVLSEALTAGAKELVTAGQHPLLPRLLGALQTGLDLSAVSSRRGGEKCVCS